MDPDQCTNCGQITDGTYFVENEYGCLGTDGIPCPHCEEGDDYCATIPHENGHIFPHDYVPFEEYAQLCSIGQCACPPMED